MVSQLVRSSSIQSRGLPQPRPRRARSRSRPRRRAAARARRGTMMAKAHDRKTRLVQRLQALDRVDLKAGKGPAMRIAVVGCGEQRQRVGHIIDAAGEKADMIERGAEGMHAGARDRAETRFEADHAVEGGRPDHRAQRLRAERQRHKAGRDRGRGAGRRAARRMRGCSTGSLSARAAARRTPSTRSCRRWWRRDCAAVRRPRRPQPAHDRGRSASHWWSACPRSR